MGMMDRRTRPIALPVLLTHTCRPMLKLAIQGDAENARHEIAGHENAAPECKGGKCET